MTEGKVNLNLVGQNDDVKLGKLLTRVFGVATGITIATLFFYRLLWIARVLGLWGLIFDNEDFLNYKLGPISLITGDPGLYLALLLFLIILVPVLLLSTRRSSPLEGLQTSFQWLIYYSLAMIAVQFLFVPYARAVSRLALSQIVNPTIFFWGGEPDDGGHTLFQVPDPHYLTLVIGIIGVLMLRDPRVVVKMWDSTKSLFSPWLKKTNRL